MGKYKPERSKRKIERKVSDITKKTKDVTKHMDGVRKDKKEIAKAYEKIRSKTVTLETMLEIDSAIWQVCKEFGKKKQSLNATLEGVLSESKKEENEFRERSRDAYKNIIESRKLESRIGEAKGARRHIKQIGDISQSGARFIDEKFKQLQQSRLKTEKWSKQWKNDLNATKIYFTKPESTFVDGYNVPAIPDHYKKQIEEIERKERARRASVTREEKMKILTAQQQNKDMLQSAKQVRDTLSNEPCEGKYIPNYQEYEINKGTQDKNGPEDDETKTKDEHDGS
ncbi:MAG: hypothetical protein H8E17_11095 [Deltaproteobacteria bacterium]|nr:hypothetical protein [Deltaproteobacteria bacterium]